VRPLTRFSMPLPAALLFCSVGVAEATSSHWEQIYLESLSEIQLPDGTTRTLHPSCSGGPQRTEAGVVPANTDYYFFVQRGNPNSLLIYLDGGGACWDADTCIGSPLTGKSTYTVSLDETPIRLADAEGIFDRSNLANPFRHYTKIFVPYCSGDVHWGSRDTEYVLDLGPGGLLRWTIHHRGMDNFLAVLNWLQKFGNKQYRIDLEQAHDVTVTGASAGGYGAQLAFPYVAELTPMARLNLICDSAIGVVTEDFYTTAIYAHPHRDSESWGVKQNLPSWVRYFNETLLARGEDDPNGLVPSVFAALSDYKPATQMASLTSNFDLVQIFFYGLMKGVVPPYDGLAGEWYVSMAQMTAATVASLPNYRFFIDDGTFHTFLGSDEHFYEVGANGISLADWIREMIKPANRVWDNLDAGNHSAPPPPPPPTLSRSGWGRGKRAGD
jgi:hypothetical protein